MSQEADQIPHRTPEQHVQRWVQNIHSIPEGTPEREEADATLRRQIISAYGLGAEETGQLTESRDVVEVENRFRLLGRLASPETLDPVDRARAETFAYGFAHLVWKDAYAQHRIFTTQKERSEMHRLATHDSLTGLLNRLGLAEKMEEMISNAASGAYEGLALLFLDIDRFKKVNDHPELGHAAGDALLQGLARVIESNIRKPEGSRPGDVVARPGVEGGMEGDHPGAQTGRLAGDEFLVLLSYVKRPSPDPSSAEQTPNLDERTEEIVSRLNNAITDYLTSSTNGRIPGIGVSIGYAVWKPGTGQSALLRLADASMYQTKELHRRVARRSI